MVLDCVHSKFWWIHSSCFQLWLCLGGSQLCFGRWIWCGRGYEGDHELGSLDGGVTTGEVVTLIIVAGSKAWLAPWYPASWVVRLMRWS
jgi:hypothetical protein